MVDTSTLLAKQDANVQKVLGQFKLDFVSNYRQWVFDNLNLDVYRPSEENVFSFMASTLRDNIDHYDLSVQIEWQEYKNTWELLEPFNDWFGD